MTIEDKAKIPSWVSGTEEWAVENFSKLLETDEKKLCYGRVQIEQISSHPAGCVAEQFEDVTITTRISSNSVSNYWIMTADATRLPSESALRHYSAQQRSNYIEAFTNVQKPNYFRFIQAKLHYLLLYTNKRKKNCSLSTTYNGDITHQKQPKRWTVWYY